MFRIPPATVAGTAPEASSRLPPCPTRRELISAGTRNPDPHGCIIGSSRNRRPGPSRFLAITPFPTRKPARRATSTALQPEAGFLGRTSTSGPQCPSAVPSGHPLYRKINCCRLQQTTIRTAYNRARGHAQCQSPVWSPGVRTESRRPKVAPWRPPASKSPCAKSFVSGGTPSK